MPNHPPLTSDRPKAERAGGQSHCDGEARVTTGGTDRFRRLQSHEVVRQGDFVVAENRKLEPWEGPAGFRANAFVKPIYRRQERGPTRTKKLP